MDISCEKLRSVASALFAGPSCIRTRRQLSSPAAELRSAALAALASFSGKHAAVLAAARSLDRGSIDGPNTTTCLRLMSTRTASDSGPGCTLSLVHSFSCALVESVEHLFGFFQDSV